MFGMARFNEVAPGGASQAFADLESLQPFGQLQRSRSWWSESGFEWVRTTVTIQTLQRSRSWWSESGLGLDQLARVRSHASTKSLLVERVRRFIQMPLILK